MRWLDWNTAPVIEGAVSSRSQKVLQILLLAGAVAGAVWLWCSGTLQALDVAQLRSLIAGAGLWGPGLYLLLFGLLQPVGLSAHMLVPAAALVWSPPLAILWAWLGTVLAAVVAFVAARTFAREAIQARVPPRLRRWDDALAERGLRTVLVLRLVFWTTFPVQMMFGLSRVRFRDYLLGSMLGNLPMVVIEVLFVERVLGWVGG